MFLGLFWKRKSHLKTKEIRYCTFSVFDNLFINILESNVSEAVFRVGHLVESNHQPHPR